MNRIAILTHGKHKLLFVFLFFCVSISLFAASGGYYKTGDVGPAGGRIIYDCDADNEQGNGDGLISSECGWRYLELAPEIIKIGRTSRLPFGYYRLPSGRNNLYVNGTETNKGEICTRSELGAGKKNTEFIVNAMKDAAITGVFNSSTSSDYAAKLCADYEYGGYDDWFLPSIDELLLTDNNLNSSYGFWSSTESDSASRAFVYYGGKAYSSEDKVMTTCYVCAVRAFLPTAQEYSEYSIGSYGPAKGFVFYDKGEYTDGWRYLEVAPEYIKVSPFGLAANFRIEHSKDFGDVINYDLLYSNGTKTFNANDCTGTAVGTGKKNTELLVESMGSNGIREIGQFTYTSQIDDNLFKQKIAKAVNYTSDYAAFLCYNAEINGYDDWFLPSLDELKLICENLYLTGKATSLFKQFGNKELRFWSSSESDYRRKDDDILYVYYLDFTSNYSYEGDKIYRRDDYYGLRSLLIRAF